MEKFYQSLISAFLMMALSISMVSGASIPASQQPVHANLTLETLSFDGLKRTYYLYLPLNYKSTTKLPVVIALHGGGKGDGDKVAEITGYNKLADQEGFIAVYPNGVDGQWNDGREKTYRKTNNTKVNDVGFLSALIAYVIHTYKGDAAKIYVTGISNGGMMTLRLGCKISSSLAAIAPVIANIPVNIVAMCKPDSPLPVLVMNGTKDPLVPWGGGSVRFFRRKMGEVVSTAETVQFWVKHNQCDLIPDIVMLPDNDRNDRSRVKVFTYKNNKNGADVLLYAIEGGGHNLPGSNTQDYPYILGRKNRDINGPEVIWEFFKQYSR